MCSRTTASRACSGRSRRSAATWFARSLPERAKIGRSDSAGIDAGGRSGGRRYGGFAIARTIVGPRTVMSNPARGTSSHGRRYGSACTPVIEMMSTLAEGNPRRSQPDRRHRVSRAVFGEIGATAASVFREVEDDRDPVAASSVSSRESSPIPSVRATRSPRGEQERRQPRSRVACGRAGGVPRPIRSSPRRR